MRVPRLDNLQLRITLLFLLIALVPLGVLSLFAVQTADAVITSIVTNQLENVASEKQGLLQLWLRERKTDLAVVAGSATLRSLDRTQIAPYLELVRHQYGVYRRFVVADREGRAVYDSDRSGAAESWSDAPWFREALGGQTHMSEIRLEPGQRESGFFIAQAIGDAQGKPQGVVCATVGTASILAGVLRVSLGQTGESYLVDGDGTFLAHKEPARIFHENIAQSGSFARLFGSEHRQPVYTDYRGIAVLGASRPVQGTPWHLVVEQDRDEAFAGSYRLARQIYVVIAVTAGMAIAVSWLLGYYVTAPIRRLSDAAGALASGDFEQALHSAQTERHDEIGRLYAAFVDMASRLQVRHLLLQQRVGYTEEELRKTGVRLESTMQAAARSEHLAALGRLASGVAHEIRTPLASLKLFLESLAEEMELSPEQSKDSQFARREILRMETTINHFLQFARPREPRMARLDFPRLIEEALEVVQPRARRQRVVLTQEVAETLPEVEGDLGQLCDCLVNLLVNALEAMPDGGQLHVALVPETLDCSGGERTWVRLAVSDSGPGIADDDLEHLFEPFFTTKASGSGLGLPVVQNTVHRHRGVVGVRTELGKGTTFVIHLPAAVGSSVS